MNGLPEVFTYHDRRVFVENITTEEQRKQLVDTCGSQLSVETSPLPFSAIVERSTRTIFALVRSKAGGI
jgi:hypothetical protein